MTEEQAREWLHASFDASAMGRLEQFASLVIAENGRQNLIAPSTVQQLWSRHMADSAQLVALAKINGLWLDIGTGGGFPGLVIALLRPEPIILVEPRRRRADFLRLVCEQLGTGSRVRVEQSKVESLKVEAQVISARAVASLENLLRAASACATIDTRWLLPRGRLESSDVSELEQRWKGMFHVEQSITDVGSSILIADRVTRR